MNLTGVGGALVGLLFLTVAILWVFPKSTPTWWRTWWRLRRLILVAAALTGLAYLIEKH
jgi:hypothetical protein